jgi:hypothetical protein
VRAEHGDDPYLSVINDLFCPYRFPDSVEHLQSGCQVLSSHTDDDVVQVVEV